MILVCAYRNWRLVLLLILAVLGADSATFAQPPKTGERAERVFSVHDIDADGYLNRQEYETFLEQRRRCHVASGRPARDFRHPFAFSEIDANGDHYISEPELTAVLGQRLRERKRRHRANTGHD